MQDNTKSVVVKMTARRCFRTEPIWQYDGGHVLTFEGFDLPMSFEVHFSRSPVGKAIPQIGTDGVCTVPEMFTQDAGVIYAWLYIVDVDSRLTKYSIEIPVAKRAKPTNQEPTPVEQSAIDQAIAALNAGVEAAEDAQEAAEAAQASAESYAEGAGQSAITATNAANSATSAKTAAETAARNAATSATDANESRQAADQSATNAGVSERNAAASASAAAGSATSAATSAGQASASATAASGSASTASTKASEAAQSATAAAGSAASASEAAGTASTAATAAGQSATAAAGSATAAAGSATSAGQSATAAAGSAQAAQDVLDSIPADYSELSDGVNSLKSALHSDEELLYTVGANVTVTQTAQGWKLNDTRDGLCASNGAYKLVKCNIVAGTKYYVVTSDLFQFQSAANVPSSGVPTRVGNTYGSANQFVTAPEGSTILVVSATLSEQPTIKVVNSDVKKDTENLSDAIQTLDESDYIKLSNITIPSGLAIRFVPVFYVGGAINDCHIEFDYDSTEEMQFSQYRIALYGGSNTSGAVQTELATTGVVSGFKHHISADLSSENTSSFDYAQIFIEFQYSSSDYNEDIILNEFTVKINGNKTKIYACNKWNNSSMQANFSFKSNLIAGYAKKSELPPTYQRPIIAIVDDDTNYTAPNIWNAILQDNTDVKIGFACMTGYMNGTFVPSSENDQYRQMTLAQLKTFYENGHEVYSHGWGGYSVSSLTAVDLTKECWKSKDWLFSNGFVRGMNTMVYSGGANDDSAQQDIVRGFYNFGVNSQGGGINENVMKNPMYISRAFGDTASLQTLTGIVDNYLNGNGGILVFGFHAYELNKNATANIEKVRSLITYIKTTGAKIVPLEQALKSIYGRNI